MLNILLPLALTFSNPTVDTVYNTSQVQEIDGRSVVFGVKETVEEIALDKEIDGHIRVVITKIESPQQMLNVAGLQ